MGGQLFRTQASPAIPRYMQSGFLEYLDSRSMWRGAVESMRYAGVEEVAH